MFSYPTETGKTWILLSNDYETPIVSSTFLELPQLDDLMV